MKLPHETMPGTLLAGISLTVLLFALARVLVQAGV